MSNTSGLSVRVQLAPPSIPTTAGVPKTEYLWGRIVAVVLVGATILGLGGYGLWQANGDVDSATLTKTSNVGTQPLAVTPANAIATPTPIVKGVSQTATKKPANKSVQQQALATKVAVPKTKVAVPKTVEPKTIGPKNVESIAPETDKIAPETEILVTTPATSSKPASASDKPAQTLAKSETSRAATVAGPTHPKQAPLAPISLRSPHVTRAQLKEYQKGQQQGHDLPASVSLADRTLLKIQFYTRYKDLQGEWVYHNWYRNGVLVASIKNQPQKNRTSAYSSKSIDRYQTGDWQVNVVNQKNQVLASAEFTVTL